MKIEIIEFQKARKELISYLGLVPAGKREIVCMGTWSPKDLLSHFIGWAEFQCSIVNNIIQGKEAEHFTGIKEYNEESVNKRKAWHWDKTYKEFLKAGEKLISVYLKLPEKKWDSPVWKNKKMTPRKLLKIETRHYQGEHLEKIISIIC